MTRRASFPIKSFKAIDRKAGTFEALVAVFGNVDLMGDRILPGAFAASLEDWRAKGDPIPIIWSHQWDDPFAHIGFADPNDVIETNEGLLIQKGVLDMDKPFAAQVYDLMDARRVKEFSFAYGVVDEEKSKDVPGANDLITLDLFESGPTLKGANPETQLVGVKAFRDELDRQVAALEKTVKNGPAPSAPKPGQKAFVQLAGSIESGLSDVNRAIAAWAADAWGHDLFYACSEATFDDHVVAYVEMWEDDWGGGSYWDIPYTRADDGTVTLGDAVAVDLQGQIVPKSRRSGRKGWKVGARNSADDLDRIQSIHDASAFLGADCATVAGEDGKADEAGADAGEGKADEPDGAKAEDRDPVIVRTLAEAELLSV